MTQIDSLQHQFVHFVPDNIEDGVLYISIPFAIAVHSCCCGCGSEVVTPLHPQDWSMTFDGQAVSLSPSVGSWGLPCQSHYWIHLNQVRWILPNQQWHDAFSPRRHNLGWFGRLSRWVASRFQPKST